MKLIELEPRWIHPNLFVFLCPHCWQTRGTLLTCKNVFMSDQNQYDLYEKEFGEDWNLLVNPCRAETSWNIIGTIPNDPKAAFICDLTVTPSIDASPSGHWHGHIANGEVV